MSVRVVKKRINALNASNSASSTHGPIVNSYVTEYINTLDNFREQDLIEILVFGGSISLTVRRRSGSWSN